MPTIEIIGLIAAVCTTMAFIPQVYKALKHKTMVSTCRLPCTSFFYRGSIL
ncbi:PQ-loop domain-containing transporter [Flagellimonas lutaonensis]|uniref:PQ-loop domain-containing transporter n=1 Tax=Flagellimonas lutaonensis TaxID=516051 RepID=UPI000A006120